METIMETIITDLIAFANNHIGENATKKIDKYSVKVSPTKVEFKYDNSIVCSIVLTQTNEKFIMFTKPTSKKFKAIINSFKKKVQ